MEPKLLNQLRQSLRRAAEMNAAGIQLLEQAELLLRDEFKMDPLSYWQAHKARQDAHKKPGLPVIDYERLSVSFRGRSCFLGNTLSFHLLTRLVRRAGEYLTYEELLTAVWCGQRSDATVRSAVKRLRAVLRRAGLTVLADAISGSTPGHYALKLDS